MPQGNKAKYSEKQKRKAEHIEDSYVHKGVVLTISVPEQRFDTITSLTSKYK